jgi:7-cyano-7-deazaguanine synthase
MNDAVKSAGYDIEICAPYLDWPKWKIGGLAQEMGIQVNEIWTCYQGGETPCGNCPACKKLESAFA